MSVAAPQSPITDKQLQKPPVNSGHRAWWRTGAELIIVSACAVAGVELFLNIAGVGMEEILQPDPVLGTRHIPGKRVVWRMEGFSDEHFSSTGLRDVEHSIVKPPNTYRVALLGDSATEALQVPLSTTYGALLQKLIQKPGLKTEVLNFGCSSFSTGQEVVQFEKEVAQYKPDLTILMYNRGDALEDVRNPNSLSCEPRPYFFVDNSGQLQDDNAVLTYYGKRLQPDPLWDFLRTNSRIYGILTQANLNLSLHEPLYRKVRGWLLTPFTARAPKIAPQNAPYAQQDAWAVTSKLISRLNASCKAAGSKLMVVDFPNIVKDPEYAKQIDALNTVAQNEQFLCYDLTDRFRWDPDPMSLFVQYHFSVKGHKKVANLISGSLVRAKY